MVKHLVRQYGSYNGAPSYWLFRCWRLEILRESRPIPNLKQQQILHSTPFQNLAKSPATSTYFPDQGKKIHGASSYESCKLLKKSHGAKPCTNELMNKYLLTPRP